jgi:Holliday junction resolvase RusA-like endonuclease
MKSFEFEVEAEPKGKARPRFVRRGNFVQTYTPKKTHDYEKLIAKSFTDQGGTLFDYPFLEVDIEAYFPIPKSTSKAKKSELLTSWHNKKPDTDNVAKAILDGLNGIAWADDKQVVSLKVKKYYGRQPKAIIKIKEVEVHDN